MLDELEAKNFTPYVREKFRVHPSSSRPIEAELVEVSEYELRAEEVGPTDRKRRRPFSILFKIENDPPLPQDIYTLEHNEMATMELFLVPIGREGDGFLYEAVFN